MNRFAKNSEAKGGGAEDPKDAKLVCVYVFRWRGPNKKPVLLCYDKDENFFQGAAME